MNLFKAFATPLLLAAFLLATSAIHAEEGGGKSEGGGKEALIAKVAPIIVNLAGPTQKYVQVEIIFKLAKPETGEKIKTYMPVIRHKLILLLSSKDANQLESSEGKQKLLQESKNAVNQAMGLTDKEGVTDVLFSSFIIQ